MSNVFAIVPARGDSQGIPLKNLRELGGKPLVQIAAEQGKEADPVDHVIINSDHEAIRAVAEEVDVEAMDRPDRYAHDNTVQEVDRLLQWSVKQLESDGREVGTVVLLYPTAPLRTVETIEATVNKVVDDVYDSAHTLYEDDSYLWEVDEESGTVEPTNYDPTKRGPRQKEDWNQWVENLAVYATDRDILMETGVRVEGETGYVEMPRWRSIDIDEPQDLHIARLLWNNMPDEEAILNLPDKLENLD